MKQPKLETVDSLAVSPTHSHVISAEFVRIRRLMNANKIADAWLAAQTVHEKHANDPLANYIMALILFTNKQKSESLSYAEAAVRHSPDNALYNLFLGKLYVDLEMPEFAPAVLAKAAALDKTMFHAPWTLADYYFGLGQGDKAIQYCQRALGLAPMESFNRIKLDYAACIAALGRVSEAESLYSELFSDPDLRRKALASYALLKKNDQNSEIAEHIRAELASTDLTQKDRSNLLLCLGRLFENGGKYDEAFHYFQESRKLSVNSHEIRHFRAKVDDKINTLVPDTVLRFQEFGDSSDKPIFVVGMPRSGTTLTEQIIAAHSQAFGVGEVKRIGLMAKKFACANGTAGLLAKMTEMGPSRWKAVSQQYMDLLNVLAPGARHTVDKMPHNFLNLGFIHFCFPNAKIIHCKRNPLDNFVSAFQNNMGSQHGYAYDQVAYGEHYLEYMRLMDHWKSVFPQSIYESQYENLTQNPEAEIRKILDFLGLPWEEACLRFNERKSTVKTFSRLEVRNPINTRSIGRWRNYEKHLSPIIAALNQAGIPI